MRQELLITHFGANLPQNPRGSPCSNTKEGCPAGQRGAGALETLANLQPASNVHAGCNFGCTESTGKQPFNHSGEPASCRSLLGSTSESHPQPRKKIKQETQCPGRTQSMQLGDVG